MLACAGCSLFDARRIDVEEIYARPDVERVPVIVVPGVVGSFLGDRKTGEVGWVRSAEAFLLASSSDLALKHDDPARAKKSRYISLGILDRVPVIAGLLEFPQFSPVLSVLEEAGYTIGSCEFPRPEEDAFVFHFDFRQDAFESVRKLSQAVERVRATRRDPTQRVALLAQSYGGLVARYYLMYGEREAIDDASAAPDGRGADSVSHVVFFGTPQTGALALFQLLKSGYVIGLNDTVMSPAVVATFPATYQGLPRPSESLFLDATLRPFLDADGKPLSLYNADTWKRIGWIHESRTGRAELEWLQRALDRGRRWWAALERPWTPPAGIRFLTIAGGSLATPRRAVLEPEDDGAIEVAFEAPSSAPSAARANRAGPVQTPGDGRVTLESALAFPFGARLLTDAKHDLMHHDRTVLSNVLLFLLEPTLY